MIRVHIERLMAQYGKALKDEEDWRIALTACSTDSEIEVLWGTRKSGALGSKIGHPIKERKESKQLRTHMTKGQQEKKAEEKKIEKKVEKAVEKKVVGKVPQAQSKAKNKKKGGKSGGAGNVGTPISKPATVVAAPLALAESSRSYFRVRNINNGKYAGGIHVQGRDFWSSVTFATTRVAGETLFNSPVNPNNLTGSRVADLAALYEKFKFNKFDLIVQPSTNATVSGAYGITYDADPSDVTPVVGDSGIREFFSHMGTVTSSVWQPATLKVKVEEPVTDYYVDAAPSGGDERLVEQGQVYLWCLNQVSANCVLNIEIEYDLVLYLPQRNAVMSAVQYQATGGTATPPSATWAMWSALRSGAATAYPNLGTLGNAAELALSAVQSDSTKSYINMAKGVWEVVQFITGQMSALPTIGQYITIGEPTLTALDERESDLVERVQLTNNTWTFDGTGKIFTAQRSDLVIAPPSGVTIQGLMVPGSVTGALAGGSGKITLRINPSSLDLLSGTALFLPKELSYKAWCRPGKHGQIMRKRLRDHMSQFAANQKALGFIQSPPVREAPEAAPIQASIPLIQSGDVAPVVCKQCSRFPCVCPVRSI